MRVSKLAAVFLKVNYSFNTIIWVKLEYFKLMLILFHFRELFSLDLIY